MQIDRKKILFQRKKFSLLSLGCNFVWIMFCAQLSSYSTCFCLFCSSVPPAGGFVDWCGRLRTEEMWHQIKCQNSNLFLHLFNILILILWLFALLLFPYPSIFSNDTLPHFFLYIQSRTSHRAILMSLSGLSLMANANEEQRWLTKG